MNVYYPIDQLPALVAWLNTRPGEARILIGGVRNQKRAITRIMKHASEYPGLVTWLTLQLQHGMIEIRTTEELLE